MGGQAGARKRDVEGTDRKERKLLKTEVQGQGIRGPYEGVKKDRGKQDEQEGDWNGSEMWMESELEGMRTNGKGE